MTDERALIERLRNRDEVAFVELVRAHSGSLLAIARLYVPNADIAEEIVQDAWIAVIKGIDGFQLRSSFKTWVSRIVMNLARTRGVREKRIATFSDLVDVETSEEYVPVDVTRFQGQDGEFPDHWSVAPRSWNLDPERQVLNQETMAAIESAVVVLPEVQRVVITLRDIQGWSAEEVCNGMDLSATNQRVLLHRARSKVRATLENHYSDAGRVNSDDVRVELQGTH